MNFKNIYLKKKIFNFKIFILVCFVINIRDFIK